jgi:hypothetical protein
MLCLLDDDDGLPFKLGLGDVNRGSWRPIRDGTPLPGWPDHVTDLSVVDDHALGYFPRVIDGVICLHGCSRAGEVGPIMTFAHELHHVTQHATVRRLWAENSPPAAPPAGRAGS